MTKISRNVNDIVLKLASGAFRDTNLELFGVKTPKIKELISVELPVVEASESRADFIFLLEDDSYLHFEFETGYNVSSLIKAAIYNLRLYERDGRQVRSVIIYTADVKTRPKGLNIGSLEYSPDMIMMADYDGDAVYRDLDAKIKGGQELADIDILNLIFLPLMRHSIDRKELTEKSIELAQTITDERKRSISLAATYSFATKYLDAANLRKLKEVIRKMTLIEMVVEDVMVERMYENMVETAKKFLSLGVGTEIVAKGTGLDEFAVRELKEELLVGSH
ncbi:MAG: hypothetical protein LBE35_04105 [Clostridiales bacterium]|nr:hypothetical protein [Clostridiales bacterium]